MTATPLIRAPAAAPDRGSRARPRTWGASLRRLGRALAAAVFPSRCAGCGAWIDLEAHPSPELLASLLCADCRLRLRFIATPLCRICGRPFAQRADHDHYCGECLQNPPPYDMARSAAVYAPPLDALVQRLKYDGRLQTARPLGDLLRAAFQHNWSARPVDLILPVPLHRRRLRSRGFNQVQVLLRDWSRPGSRQDLAPVAAAVAPRLLVRRRHTPPQAGLPRPERIRNMRGAFAVTQPRAVAGRRILVVDDVMTTGATLAACVEVLRNAGAARVDVLTLARAVRND
jgi:ComF family protein